MRWFALVVIAVALWAIMLAGSTPDNRPRPNRYQQAAAPVQPRVVYELRAAGEGYASADITIENRTGGTDQMTVALPWRYSFDARPGQFVYLSAQLKTPSYMTARILVNGNVLQEASASGQHKIASVSGRVPGR